LKPCRFVTGPPGIGKTTAVRRAVALLKERGVGPGGFYTGELREAGRRIGFFVEDVRTGARARLAELGPGEPRVGRYRLVGEGLGLAKSALESALFDAQVLVVDEVGPMELKAPGLREAIRAALECNRPTLGSVHQKSLDPLARWVRESCAVLTLSVRNRDRAPAWLAGVWEGGGDGRAQKGA